MNREKRNDRQDPTLIPNINSKNAENEDNKTGGYQHFRCRIVSGSEAFLIPTKGMKRQEKGVEVMEKRKEMIRFRYIHTNINMTQSTASRPTLREPYKNKS